MIKDIKLKGTYVLVSHDRYEDDVRENGIIQTFKGTLKDIQTVFAVGDSVNIGNDDWVRIEKGQKVYIDNTPYLKAVQKNGYDNVQQQAWSVHSKDYKLMYVGPMVTVNGVEYALIDANNIIGVVETE